jgi:hypothetical protein
MNAKRQIAMVKSVAKNMRAKERKQKPEEERYSTLYAILRKVGKPLDEVKKADLNKKDYEFVLKFVTEYQGFHISLCPNLQ